MANSHTDRAYEADLERLREGLLVVGSKVADAVVEAMRALRDRDAVRATRVIEGDREVNRRELDIDELCLRILALRQPAASDLRFIAAALKTVTDLERIGDCAAHIAARARALAAEPATQLPPELARMTEVAESMVHDAIDALVQRDAAKAEAVMKQDDEIDALHATFVAHLTGQMVEAKADIPTLLRLQSVAKYLERVGDHATNVGEMAIFAARGEDVRHPGSRLGNV